MKPSLYYGLGLAGAVAGAYVGVKLWPKHYIVGGVLGWVIASWVGYGLLPEPTSRLDAKAN